MSFYIKFKFLNGLLEVLGMRKFKLQKIKNPAVLIGLIGITGIAVYGAIIYPMLNAEKFKEIRKISRANIDQEKIQPGGMKVWTDPFDRKK